jgi:hypothetical protein
MRLGVPFIAPRDLGAVGAPFGWPWLLIVHGCTGLSDAHRTMNSAMVVNSVIGCFPVMGAPYRLVGGTGLSGAPVDRWPPADVAASHWLLAHRTVRRYARMVC